MMIRWHPDDTIAALASAPGAGGRGIIRVSGPRVLEVLQGLCDQRGGGHPWAFSGRPTSAAVWDWALGVTGFLHPVPARIYLWPGKKSYTGQPLAELHAAGCPPLLEAMLADCFQQGVRPAQPGEFTLRAFLAGRLDLVQAEAVLGAIDADTPSELKAALTQLAGGVSSEIGQLRHELLDLLADLEAGLDFADEDIAFVSHAALIAQLTHAHEQITELLLRAQQRLRSSAAKRVVLAGEPNAGKSTLYNSLLGTSAALVSAVAGTTRDYLAQTVRWGELELQLIDTPGVEERATGIMGVAQDLRQQQFEQADLLVWCLPADGSCSQPAGPCDCSREDHRQATLPVLRVRTKCDLASLPQSSIASPPHPLEWDCAVSAVTGAGLAELRQRIVERLSSLETGPQRQLVGTTAARCGDSLRRAQAALERALQVARHEADQELLALEIREALQELGTIVGEVYTDDLLDRIFSKFCIGK